MEAHDAPLRSHPRMKRMLNEPTGSSGLKRSPTNRLRKIREVLRLRHECQRSHRQIAASCDISPASVGEYLKRA